MENIAYTSPPRRKMEWKRAWGALRNLIADSERTDQVFEIVRALSGNSWERAFERFCAHPDGRRLLQERPSLLAALADREHLRKLPQGSFGRAYAEFMDSAQLDAKGLVDAEHMSDQNWEKETVDPDREYFGDRLRDMHDLWHVLTGYGRDEAGEAANLAFTLGQIPQPGVALIVLAGAILGPKDISFMWPRYLFSAWRRGRQAALLSAAPYERLLSEPLEEVRQLLRIQPAGEVHPAGIIVGNRVLNRDTGGEASAEAWEMRRANS